MSRNDSTRNKKFQGPVAGWRMARRPLRALFGLLALLTLGTPVAADNRGDAPLPLELALKTDGPKPTRITMRDGQKVIGRMVTVDSEHIVIRRPVGGLRSLSIVDVRYLEFEGSDGKLHRGPVTKLADGRYGIALIAGSAKDPTSVTADASPADDGATGGPLIKASTTAAAGLRDASGPVRLNVTVDPVEEGDALVTFHLRLSQPSAKPVVIIYSTVDGTAKAALDYRRDQGVLVIEPGEVRAEIVTALLDDDTIEQNETFQLFVTGDPKTVAIDRRSIPATIRDDDA